jgi:hypothetical protein
MSIADQESENEDEETGICDIHRVAFWSSRGCPGCELDEADRAYDARRDRHQEDRPC